MRTVGISCTPKLAYFALALDGEIIESDPERLEVAAQNESSEELIGTRDDAKRMLHQLSVERVGLLMPEEKPRRNPTYQELLPRIALETMIRVAAVEEGIAIELLARPTVRSRLGLGPSGSLRTGVTRAVSSPAGRYWNEGRGIAALAALAAEKGPR